MSDLDLTEAIDAAMRTREAVAGKAFDVPGSAVRDFITAVLRAVAPLIEAQVRQRIAAEIEAAQFGVASVHHFHRATCLCDFVSDRARSRTEHILECLNAAEIARGDAP